MCEVESREKPTGNELLGRCESVKQYHSEAIRIARRTIRILLALDGAWSEFSGNVAFNANLNELKGALIKRTG